MDATGSQRLEMWRARGYELLQRLDGFVGKRERLVLWCALLVAVSFAMRETSSGLDMPPNVVESALRQKDDIRYLYMASSHASWSDVPRWWYGPWNYPGVPYYRPLASMLYFLEYRAFGKNFGAYNRTTWTLHGLNCTLLFLLVASLFRHYRYRFLLGMGAIYYFSSTASTLYFGIGRALTWWPAQNDVMSLTFGLLCLLLLDQYLTATAARPYCHPRILRCLLLAGSLLAMAGSICTKEMGYITMPVALALIYHRRRRLSYEMAAFLALTAAFWVLRKIVVPDAWAPVMFRPWILYKFMLHSTGVIWTLAMAGVYWPLAAGPAVTMLVVLGLKRKWPVWMIACASLIAASICGCVFEEAHTWALLTVGQNVTLMGRLLSYMLAVALFWRYRREEPGLLMGVMLILVFVPILQYGGMHYFYWPGAFLGAADAAFLACLWRWWKHELREGANWSLEWPRPLRKPAVSDSTPLPLPIESGD